MMLFYHTAREREAVRAAAWEDTMAIDDRRLEDGQEWRRDPYRISTDRRQVDLDVVHGFLTTFYWSPGIPREVVRRALEHSLPFGLYRGPSQIGLARVVTDYATFAYLCDVFILPDARGQGLGKWLMAVVADHPALQGLRRWVLTTRDAHGLYRHSGFTDLAHPERFMERVVLDAYGARGGRTERTDG